MWRHRREYLYGWGRIGEICPVTFLYRVPWKSWVLSACVNLFYDIWSITVKCIHKAVNEFDFETKVRIGCLREHHLFLYSFQDFPGTLESCELCCEKSFVSGRGALRDIPKNDCEFHRYCVTNDSITDWPIQDITWTRGDRNFILECWWYLSRESAANEWDDTISARR